MARRLELDELVEHFTLLPDEVALLRNKSGATRLGFALLLRFFTARSRFPSGRGELTEWLASNVCEAERRHDQVREEFLARCRAERIEPPTPGRVDRPIRSALRTAEKTLTIRIAGRLPAEAAARLRALVDPGVDEADLAGEDVLSLIKSVPGNVSLDSMLTEIRKVRAVRAVGLPAGLFADIAPKVLTGWRARAAVEAPSHLREHSDAVTLTLLAALLHCREREITDTLVDLLIQTVHRIGARADRRVTDELINAFKKVTGKENILFAIAEASLEHPDDAVRKVVYPAVTGGEQTLRELVHEYKTKGPVYRRTVQTTLKASYTNHYRRGLIALLDVLEFRSNNTAHRPVLDALALVKRYADGRVSYYPAGEHVPTHKGVLGDWSTLAFKETRGRRRVVRSVYEIGTFQALRDQLRCKEIWVVGAHEYRNPDQDLPADFESRRGEHYAALRKPLDPGEFINGLREEMRAELAALDERAPALDWVEFRDRGMQGAIKLTALDALPEPRNLRRLKTEIRSRWGTVPLIDMLKEAVLRTGCLQHVTAAAGRGDMPTETLAERLLLAVYAYGTNTGLRSVAGGGHGHSEDDLRYVRRRYLTAAVARAMAVEIANATFAARQQTIWGTGSTAVASDSTHFGAFDQNIFTEWHNRYGGRGVLIYWHVERKSMAIHSQVINCSASEVAAMVEGAIRHGTTMEVEGNYVDTHGQSEIGFGITRLLGFDLLPRIKRINKVRLYRPAAGEPGAFPNLAPALISRAIRWDLIAQQYDQMIKYATAIRTLFFGKGGDIATNRRDDQELSVLCLRVLQCALVYINTLMLQDVLADDDWTDTLTPEDRRGLTPLFWTHVAPYGEVKLDMTSRLSLRDGSAGR